MGGIVPISFCRTWLEIAMDGGFRPPPEARKIQEMLERVTGAIRESGVPVLVVVRTLRDKREDSLR